MAARIPTDIILLSLMTKYICFCMILLVGFQGYYNTWAQPAFPGAEGLGTMGLGGRVE
ncbi:MAG: hypothetical protein ACETVZ_05710 [Phycisphaerae bacterium]